MQAQLPYERVKISSLVLDPDNVREHDEENLSIIKESLKRFEQQRTIVVSKDNIVIAGNGTVMAAKDLGWDTIDITRSQLTGEEAKAFAIVDNRSTDKSKFDDDKLRQQLEELEAAGVDMIGLGWTDDDIINLKNQFTEINAPELSDDESLPTSMTITFTVSRNQNDVIQKALSSVLDSEKKSSENDNKNGNAISWICQKFLLSL